MPKHFYRDAVIYAVPLYFMENHALTGTDMPFLSYGRITVRTYTTPDFQKSSAGCSEVSSLSASGCLAPNGNSLISGFQLLLLFNALFAVQF